MDNEIKQEQTREQVQEQEWWLTETTKGFGPPPANYINASYKNVEAQLKAQRDGQAYITKISQQLKGHLGAPNEYNFTFDGDEKEAFNSWGKKYGITQECMVELNTALNTITKKKEDREHANNREKIDIEIKKIGGVEKIDELKAIFKEYYGDKYNNCVENINTAEEYDLLSSLIKTRPSKISVEPAVNDNIESLQGAIRSKRFMIDHNYAEEIITKLNNFYKKA